MTFLSTRRGKLTLLLLCAIAFLDFVDASIVNVALPAIRSDLHFSVQSLQWVPSGYLLTYGGFMLLGGRAADLLGRRRVLLTGTLVFGLSSAIGGLAPSAGVLVGARFVQGVGAAMMLPAALSILTTSFTEGGDRHKALGVWGGVAGLASAAGVLLGGVLTEGPGWRWVMLVNPPICLAVLAGATMLFEREERRTAPANFDVVGTLLATSGLLLLVFTLVKAPDVGWDAVRTIGGLVGALVLLVTFVINELRSRNPLLPLSIFQIRGLGAADVTHLVAVAGLSSMFFFLSLYMENVLHYSPIQTGSAYLPLCVGVGVSSGIAAKLLTRTGTRPLIVFGLILTGVGLYLLAQIPTNGSYSASLLPGLLIASLGLGAVFVPITTAANAGVPPETAGLAAALLNTSQQLGGALGLAIFSAVATSRTDHLLATGTPPPRALTEGFQRALLASCLFVLAAAVIALRASNTRGDAAEPEPVFTSEPASASKPATPSEPASAPEPAG